MKSVRLPTHRFFTFWTLKRLVGHAGKNTKPASMSEVQAEKAALMAMPGAQRAAEIIASMNRKEHHAKTCEQAEAAKAHHEKRRKLIPRSRHLRRRALPFPRGLQPVRPAIKA